MHDGDDDHEGPYVMGTPTFDRPTLLNACARAATTEEARFRVPYPNSQARRTCVIALDTDAARIMIGVAGERWHAARFLTLSARQSDISPNDVMLIAADGAARLYTEELASADMVVLVATRSDHAQVAATIGKLARQASVMTAGIVIAKGDHQTDAVVAAMRPSSAVMVIAAGEDYLAAMLSAMRA